MTWLALSLEATIGGQPKYRKKCRNIGWNMKQVLFDIVMKRYFQALIFHNTEKTETRQWKCTTSLIRRQNHTGDGVDRNRLCFSPSQTCTYCFTCRLMCADTTKCAHFLIRKGICDWKHALERQRSHEKSMEHIDATITCSCRCNVTNHYEELMQS